MIGWNTDAMPPRCEHNRPAAKCMICYWQSLSELVKELYGRRK